MSDAQFIGIYLVLLWIMLMVEIGVFSICGHLKAIRRCFEVIKKTLEVRNDTHT